ncbi:hypothetical protein DFJ77DRAFT_460202 [Powellomyces hirtus]|nr:hypothetical protein DFJ77DRAFT_460202 [Powellomyces hirtus]
MVARVVVPACRSPWYPVFNENDGPPMLCHFTSQLDCQPKFRGLLHKDGVVLNETTAVVAGTKHVGGTGVYFVSALFFLIRPRTKQGRKQSSQLEGGVGAAPPLSPGAVSERSTTLLPFEGFPPYEERGETTRGSSRSTPMFLGAEQLRVILQLGVFENQ